MLWEGKLDNIGWEEDATLILYVFQASLVGQQ